MPLDFEVLIDHSLIDLAIELDSFNPDRKSVVSLVNNFEDGRWWFEKFQNFIWDNIAETALSYSERTALSSQPFSMLRAAAKNLRLSDSENDIGKGSELAEIVLYGIMKHKYNALPVVPKIFYKQNSQDNAKGADSVHILLDEGNEFSLWFGEAKFFNSIEDARLDKVVDSVASILETGKLKKENSIITNVSDLDRIPLNEQLRNKIKNALSNRESIDDIKPRINIPILLIHECHLTAAAKEIDNNYKDAITTLHKDRAKCYFLKQEKKFLAIHKCGEIRFHLILFPVPKKKDVVDAFLSFVCFHKEKIK